MYICYIDEAGCTGAIPDPTSSIQPVFSIAGIFVNQSKLNSLTNDLLQLKQNFFPNRLPSGSQYYDWMAVEIKGAELRRQARNTSRNDRRFAYMVIGRALEILENHSVKLVGRVYVKKIGEQFNGAAVYTKSVQSICESFQEFLVRMHSSGIVIADSRNKPKNANVAHSIFTQRHRAIGDPYSHMVELPTFGHSDNHAGLQFADLLCSSLLFPIAAQVCISPHLTNQLHCSPHYLNLKSRYGERIKNLQFRYQDPSTTYWYGGLKLSDPMSKNTVKSLFS